MQRPSHPGAPMAVLDTLLAVFVTLLLAPPASSRDLSSTTRELMLQGKARVLSTTLPDKTRFRTVLLDTRQGRVHIVESRKGLAAGVSTGMDLIVTGSWLDSSSSGSSTSGKSKGSSVVISTDRSFLATSIQASGGKRGRPPIVSRVSANTVRAASTVSGASPLQPPVLTANAPIGLDISAILIPLAGVADDGTYCPGTVAPKATVDQVKRAFFQEANRNGTTVGSLIGQCSNGRSRITSMNSLVTPLIKLGCNGTTNGVSWSMNSCTFDDFNAWSDAADQVLADRGYDLTHFKYRVYLVPSGTCGFVGLGYVGCDGSYICRAWIGGDFWGTPADMIHELGHNLFLAHAGTTRADGTWDEYGDPTSYMGYCCDLRCINTPQKWQLGWLTVQQLSAASLQPGQTVTFSLPSEAVAGQTSLRVDVTTWVQGVDPLFVGYRTAERGDRGINPSAANKVHVYSAPTKNTYDPQYTMWYGGLTAGQSYTQAASGVVVRHLGMLGAEAQVSICRIGGAETAASCAAGIDFDCNGLAGAADPACANMAMTARAAVASARQRGMPPGRVAQAKAA